MSESFNIYKILILIYIQEKCNYKLVQRSFLLPTINIEEQRWREGKIKRKPMPLI